jgi:hypothetical protein
MRLLLVETTKINRITDRRNSVLYFQFIQRTQYYSWHTTWISLHQQVQKGQHTTANETAEIQTPTQTLWHSNTKSEPFSKHGNWWKWPRELWNLDPDWPWKITPSLITYQAHGNSVTQSCGMDDDKDDNNEEGRTLTLWNKYFMKII